MSWPKYMRCKHCETQYRIELLEPATVRKAPAYCPQCGNNVAVEHDRNLDYWYTLADGFDLAPGIQGAKLIKQLYELWNPVEHVYFRSFVEEVMSSEEAS